MDAGQAILPDSASDDRDPGGIWRVDYNETVSREAAQGWQGTGFVLFFNACVFLFAFFVFQKWARSSRYQLFGFHSGEQRVQSGPIGRPEPFTLRSWISLLFHTPLHDAEVEKRLGPEGTFYLVYEVYACKLLAALSVYALLILLPLYVGVHLDVFGDNDNTNATTSNYFTSMELELVSNATDELQDDIMNNGEGEKWWSFAHTTMRSLPVGSSYLWAPVVTVYVFSGAFLFVYQKLSLLSCTPRTTSSGAASVASDMSKATTEDVAAPSVLTSRIRLVGMQPSELSSRSLFIHRGLPKKLREERLVHLLEEVFPGYVEDACVVLHLSDFHKYQCQKEENSNLLERERILHWKLLHNEPISWSLRLLPGTMTIPKLHYLCTRPYSELKSPRRFSEREQKLKTTIKKLQSKEDKCLRKHLRDNQGAGRAFLVFTSAKLRARFVRRVQNKSITAILGIGRFPDDKLPRLKRHVRELGITRWHMSMAPEPDDVDWSSVSVPFVKRTILVFVINIAIVVMLFLFTSPVAVTSAVSSSKGYSTTAARSLSKVVAEVSAWLQTVSPWMAHMMASYFPTLILVVINAVLLNVLQMAGRIQPVSSDSAKERMILRASVVYLIFNTLFVPSLAFVSIDAVLLYLQRENGEVLGVLGTLFLHNSGIFYVNYVLQRAFLGVSVHLLRLSELFQFAWMKPRALTQQEHLESVEGWRFFTGTQMAIQISILTVVLTFSTVVPVILPIGALYFGMQHAVDKYSLLHVRPKIRGRGSIARTATHATMISLLIYQMAMAGFLLTRGTKMQSTSVLVLLMVTYIITLWKYVNDKERAREQTARIPTAMGTLGSPADSDPKKEPENSPEDGGDSTKMMMFPPLSKAEESDLYREPALRKRSRRQMLLRKQQNDGEESKASSDYGSVWTQDKEEETKEPNESDSSTARLIV